LAYRRGFKSEANEIATDVRRELGLRQQDRLDPILLARHLAVPVLPLSRLRSFAEDAVEYLLHKEPEAFSAVTVFRGSRRTIVHNDAHSLGRQSSNVTHELAHALLLHDPTPPLDHRGCRIWNQNIEDEAQWLAGALLITEEASLWIVRSGMSGASAAEHFGVSEKMVTYRTNITGARRRVARARGLPALS
jgi:Zn-dependent peptidase ImmA (M78 family)